MRRGLSILLVLAIGVVACGGEDEPERLDPAAAMASAATVFAEAETFRFQIGLAGPPVIIEDTFTLQGIDGAYRAPMEAEAEVRVSVLGLGGTLSLLAIGDEVWQKGPITTEWEPVVSAQLLTVRDLFAPDGLTALFAEDITGLTWGDDTTLEEFPGETLEVLSGRTVGDRLDRLTVGVLQGENTDAVLYLADGEIRRIELTERESANPRTWTIDAFAYDRPVDITPAP